MLSQPTLNLLIIGHVDAGKSTLTASMLKHCSVISEEDIKKAGSLSAILDTDVEERDSRNHTRTYEFGYVSYETLKRKYNILDSPGHKTKVPEMLSAANLADIAILVVSAKTGEFETGLKGQTLEHMELVFGMGIRKIVIYISKLDMISPDISERCEYIIHTMTQCAKNIGFFEYHFVSDIPKLLDTIDDMNINIREPDEPLRLMISRKLDTEGYTGKVISGTLIEGNYYLNPINKMVNVHNIRVMSKNISSAGPGTIVTFNSNQDDIKQGSIISLDVLCNNKIIVDCYIKNNTLLSKGFSCVMHCHAEVITCTILGLKDLMKNKIVYANKGRVHLLLELDKNLAYDIHIPKLSRVILRSGSETIAIGSIVK